MEGVGERGIRGREGVEGGIRDEGSWRGGERKVERKDYVRKNGRVIEESN